MVEAILFIGAFLFTGIAPVIVMLMDDAEKGE